MVCVQLTHELSLGHIGLTNVYNCNLIFKFHLIFYVCLDNIDVHLANVTNIFSSDLICQQIKTKKYKYISADIFQLNQNLPFTHTFLIRFIHKIWIFTTYAKPIYHFSHDIYAGAHALLVIVWLALQYKECVIKYYIEWYCLSTAWIQEEWYWS